MNFRTACLQAYIAAIGFQTVWQLPFFGERLQLPELIFLFLAVGVIFQPGFYRFQQKNWGWLDTAIAVYLAINIVSAVRSGIPSSILESAGRVYLALVYFFAKYIIAQSGAKMEQKTAQAFWCLGLLCAGLATLGLLLHFLGKTTHLVQVYQTLPYFGAVVRAKAFCSSPNMLLYVLTFCALLSSNLASQSNWQKVAWWGMLAVALFTFSKSYLVMAAALCVLFVRSVFKFRWAILAMAAALLFVSAHFIIVPPNTSIQQSLLNTSFISNEIAFSIFDWKFYETSYWALKEGALAVWQSNVWWGVGPGNFNVELGKLQTQGLYPANMKLWDPHCTYTGALAETGLFGLLALAGLAASMVFVFIKQPRTSFFCTAIGLCFAAFWIEGLAIDTMNFRHFWVLLGIWSGWRFSVGK